MHNATMSDDDYGFSAYSAITSQLEQWGEVATSSSSRKSRGSLDSSTAFHHPYDASMDEDNNPVTPAKTSYGAVATPGDEYEAMDEDVSPEPNRFKGGVETPMPSKEQREFDMFEDDAQDVDDMDGPVVDGIDSYQPYRDAVMAYIQNRSRISNLSSVEVGGDGNALMQIEDIEPSPVDAAALEEADMKFLDSLSSICFARSNVLSSPDCLEGNVWELMSCLRSRGLAALFYCVNGESPPELELNADPSLMIDAAPSEVITACLGSSDEKPASLPLERLNAALEWIQSCHNRKWQIMVNHDYQDSEDPLLPAPRRRTMWPSTLEEMKRTNKKEFHPDAPHVTRTPSPTAVTLHPSDESDDARLLRACFILFQAGRQDQAMELTKECGQPWRSIGWLGGEALDENGNGNPTYTLWKRQARKILEKMMSNVHDNDQNLQSSLAYEAAILSVLSDDVDCAVNNPVFETWEDCVHAILSSERGLIEENVLLAHDDARVDAVGGGHFPYPGMGEGDSIIPDGFNGDMGAALQRLDSWSVEKVRDARSDPYRNGVRSFLVGQVELKEFIEECASLALDSRTEESHTDFFRFVVHLVLYVDTVLPEFAFQLALPDSVTNDDDVSLREMLLLKYTNHLTSMRELWGYVPLYTSLLSHENILALFSEFLLHVHNDQERQMMLSQARDFFPSGLDRYVLRNVVREMIQDDQQWLRGPGEDEPPSGISPADARKLRSVLWLCYYPEHHPDALVCANMLLRKFMLESDSSDLKNKKVLVASKSLIHQILPQDFIDSAIDEAQNMDNTIAGYISSQMMINLQAEFMSIKFFVDAHTSYFRFIDVIIKTSPCHQSESKSIKGSSSYETEIAQKMERNAFRQKKLGLCKIVIEYATKAMDHLMEVLTFGGGWLVDQTLDKNGDEDTSLEAIARLEEMKQIRSVFIPITLFMFHEVLNKTALWMEQVVFDTLDQFGSASPDMLLNLFGAFNNTDDTTAKLLKTSRAAPAYWHKKAISLASIVANDSHELHQAMGDVDMKKFLNMMADSQVKYDQCKDTETLFDL